MFQAKGFETDLTEADYNWFIKNYEQIASHPAWNGEISEIGATQLLKGKSAFTYVLRSVGKQREYFISFVQKDQSIKHQYFTLELGLKGWYYKNGVVAPPAENINDLIPSTPEQKYLLFWLRQSPGVKTSKVGPY